MDRVRCRAGRRAPRGNNSPALAGHNVQPDDNPRTFAGHHPVEGEGDAGDTADLRARLNTLAAGMDDRRERRAIHVLRANPIGMAGLAFQEHGRIREQHASRIDDAEDVPLRAFHSRPGEGHEADCAGRRRHRHGERPARPIVIARQRLTGRPALLAARAAADAARGLAQAGYQQHDLPGGCRIIGLHRDLVAAAQRRNDHPILKRISAAQQGDGIARLIAYLDQEGEGKR